MLASSMHKVYIWLSNTYAMHFDFSLLHFAALHPISVYRSVDILWHFYFLSVLVKSRLFIVMLFGCWFDSISLQKKYSTYAKRQKLNINAHCAYYAVDWKVFNYFNSELHTLVFITIDFVLLPACDLQFEWFFMLNFRIKLYDLHG